MGSSGSVHVKCYDCSRSFDPKITKFTYLCPQCVKIRKYPQRIEVSKVIK